MRCHNHLRLLVKNTLLAGAMIQTTRILTQEKIIHLGTPVEAMDSRIITIEHITTDSREDDMAMCITMPLVTATIDIQTRTIIITIGTMVAMPLVDNTGMKAMDTIGKIFAQNKNRGMRFLFWAIRAPQLYL